MIPDLARNHTVIAPDLLGHGGSDKPRADYSVAAYANGMRDLLSVLGIEPRHASSATRSAAAWRCSSPTSSRSACERLVLVGSGGVGRDVNPAPAAGVRCRAPSSCCRCCGCPGCGCRCGRVAAAARRCSSTDLGRDARDVLRSSTPCPTPTARRAFVRTLRAVVDWRGQVVTMLDRCYLAEGMPTLLLWGARDAVIPVRARRRAAHAAMPGSRLEIFEGAGHFPFHADPARFVELVEEFIATTAPADWSREHWRELLRAGGPGTSSGRPSGLAIAPAADRDLREASERSAT